VGAIALASVTVVAYAGGIPKARGNQQDNGPYGFPSLKHLADGVGMSHDEEQAVLRIYNDYKHKEHEEMQQAAKKDGSGAKASGDNHGAMVNEVKAVLTTEEKKKKLDDVLSESKKKKK
jgi:hypothetical protein